MKGRLDECFVVFQSASAVREQKPMLEPNDSSRKGKKRKEVAFGD
jgi:hypothetical protein